MNEKLKKCFSLAKKDETKGKKHKRLLLVEPNKEIAKLYIEKAKRNLESCEIFKEKRLDYMIPEQWFYTLYHCAQAILAAIGVESRSQILLKHKI